MLKSMTGYGRQESLKEGRKILVEIRSVNQRFTDYGIKLPKHLGFLEERVRGFASERITRGKVDIYISVESYEEADKDIRPVSYTHLDVYKRQALSCPLCR